MAPRLVLVGPPGAGKTTVGRLVAERLGVAFRDTDADIEATAGRSVADIFVADGEQAFRDLEVDAVARALQQADGVLALGGGAVLAETTRTALTGSGATVAYLQVSLGPAAKRVGLARDRPVLALNPRAALHRLLEQRAPLYAEVATVTLDTDEREPDAVADALLELLDA